MDLTRKRFLRVAAAGAVAQCSTAGQPKTPARQNAAQLTSAGADRSNPRPNVLIMMKDQYRRNYIGSPVVQTPETNDSILGSRFKTVRNVRHTPNSLAELQLVRAELFDVVSHSNFSTVSTGFGAGTFGQVTTARDPHRAEGVLRYSF
jgi:hypothetical protein